MSGPKCTEVTLSPEALRAIQVSRLQSRHRQALEQWGQIQSRAPQVHAELQASLSPIRTLEAQLRQQNAPVEPFQLEFQVPVVQVPPMPEDPHQEEQLEVFERQVDRCRVALEQQERICRQSIQQHQQMLVRQSDHVRWNNTIEHSGEMVKRRQAKAYQSPEHQEALRIQGRVDPLASPEALTAIQRKVEVIEHEMDRGQRQLEVLQLRRLAQQANGGLLERELLEVTARNLLKEAREVEVAPAELQKVESAVQSGSLSQGHVLSLKQAIQDRRAAARQEFIIQNILDVLEDLGYEVDAGMGTLYVEGEAIHAVKERWGTASLQVKPMGERHLHMRITSEQQLDPSEVMRREEEFCGDYQVVQRELTKRGIDFALKAHMPVGAAQQETRKASKVRQKRGSPKAQLKALERKV